MAISVKTFCISLVVFFSTVVLLSLPVSAISLNLEDNYLYGWGSYSDRIAFTNYEYDSQVYGIDYSHEPNLACFDWDNDGDIDFDYCVYEFGFLKDDCTDEYLSLLSSATFEQVPYLQKELKDVIDTSTRSDGFVYSEVFYDCDNSQGDRDRDPAGNGYWVVRPRENLCVNGGDDSFYILGAYDSNSWIQIYDYSCSEHKGDAYACYEVDDPEEDLTGTTYLKPVCALLDGSTYEFACDDDEDCISFDCSGKRKDVLSQCSSDGLDDFLITEANYEDTCGGEGYSNSQVFNPYSCSDYFGGNYVCDADLDGNGITEPSDFCKIKEYSACSLSADCWNHNAGYDCLGGSNKICTTGANGKSCFNNNDLQCDSGRCDATCQNKLVNGASCDENSDCINGQCSGGICGGAGVVADLAVVDIDAIQIIPDVELLKGRAGIIRVTVTNYAENPANGTVTAKFDGVSLSIASGDVATKTIPAHQNVSFLFDFIATTTGTKEVVANVTIL